MLNGALVQVRSCGTLVIFITSSGEIFLLFVPCQFCFFCTFHIKKKKKKTVLQDCFWCCLVCPISAAGSFLCCLVSALFVPGIHFQWIENFKASSLGFVGKLN